MCKCSTNLLLFASFEASTAAIFEVEVFWVVTSCSVVVAYRRFGEPCCFHLQGDDGGSILP
jgi:hypothetical protein